jgi:uncharacterized protein
MDSNRTAAFHRVLPFAIYLVFLGIESLLSNLKTDGFDWRWLYPVKISCVAIALLYFWRHYDELKTPRLPVANGLLTVAVGIIIFVVWIALDSGWAVLGKPGGYDPREANGTVNWLMASLRLFGAAIVVPVMEELFWRSFVMRWIRFQNFLKVDPKAVGAHAILISSVLFASEHHQWAAGLVAGLGYAWLYRRQGNLWMPIFAHALTNFLLGVWVLYSEQWRFW